MERCLAALEAQTVPVNVIVVDDKSPDDTLQRVRARFGSFTIIENERNRGFAATCNAGIRAGAAEFVLLLNSDVVAESHLAASVIASFDAAGPRCGSVTCMLLSPDGTVDSYGITADVTGAGFVRYHGADPSAASSGEPPLLGPYGAAAGYRRGALNDVGLFDRNIFMYGEELDLDLRLRSGGWSASIAEGPLGVHVGGASAGVESLRQRYLSGFARGYLLRVYGVLRGRHVVRAVATESLVTVVRLIARRDVASLHGRRDGWRKGRGVVRRRLPHEALDDGIGFVTSIRMRGAGYWTSR